MAKHKARKAVKHKKHGQNNVVATQHQTDKLKVCSKGQRNLQFVPIDTWFFRESRPHDAAGASELSSLFPPPTRTLAGAVRHYLGEVMEFDWSLLNADKAAECTEVQKFNAILGNADDLSPLSVRGAWVCKEGQRLYPVPFYLMHKEQALTRLQIGDAVHCDLGLAKPPKFPHGKVRLPELPEGEVGYKNYERTWLTGAGWEKILQDQTPAYSEVILQKDVLSNEPRLGIARNNATRSVLEGKLYQTQHIRLQENVCIELDMMGIDDELLDKLPKQNESIVRLGGEGRMAALNIKSEYEALPALCEGKETGQHLVIHFISPASFSGKMFPKTFTQQLNAAGETVWRGRLGESKIELDVISAVIGKVHREGGWDMQRHRPRAVKSYLPAGSAWFCYLPDKTGAKQLIDELHGQCIGEEADLGRGQILIGLWNDKQGEKNDNR